MQVGKVVQGVPEQPEGGAEAVGRPPAGLQGAAARRCPARGALVLKKRSAPVPTPSTGTRIHYNFAPTSVIGDICSICMFKSPNSTFPQPSRQWPAQFQRPNYFREITSSTRMIEQFPKGGYALRCDEIFMPGLRL